MDQFVWQLYAIVALFSIKATDSCLRKKLFRIAYYGVTSKPILQFRRQRFFVIFFFFF